MRRPWVAILFCVFIIQRAASQALCRSDLYISVDDLLRAINSGQLSLNQQGNSIGQDICGCQQLPSQNSCGSQQSSLNQQSFPIASQPISYGNQISSQPSFQVNQQNAYGCQQQSIPFTSQPSLSLSSQSCGCQPSISFSQPFCGCSSQQPSFSFASQPSISLGSSSLNQQSGCGSLQPSTSIASQPSISLNNLCGYQPSLSLNQQPSFSIASQPTVSLPSQSSCGNQQFFSASRPSLSLQRGSSNQQSLSTQSLLPQQSCQEEIQSQQIVSNQCSSPSIQSECANAGSNVGISNVLNIGSNVASVVPNALLLAPPFGIFFDGDNLIIDGAVQVCGTMPFNSAVQVSGVLPASGIGNVQYVCNDICQS